MAKESLSLERLLNTRDLERIVPRLPPEVLHRVIQHFGLEQCGEFLALASAAQILRVLDADVWRTRADGLDAGFDADRFGLWLTVLMESGPAVAAGKLMGLDLAFVACGLIHHIEVFDSAAVSAYTTLEGDYIEGRVSPEARTIDIGGFRLETQSPAADVIGELLLFLNDRQPAYFTRLMRQCVQLTNGGHEPDGFHNLLPDDEQQLFDVGQARDLRREALGYVTASHAHAFLRSAGTLRLDSPAPPHSPLASTYFRETRQEPVEAYSWFVDMLVDAGIVGSERQPMLGAGDADSARLELIRAHVTSYAPAGEELAYLANVLLAGCHIQGRGFSPSEASAAATAVCNLGLEHWPGNWNTKDLVTAFQIGWQLLRRDVCLRTATRLVELLRHVHVHDRDLDVQLSDLRRKLAHAITLGMPWQVRDSLDVLLQLDATSWAGVVALLDECPVLTAAVRCSATTRTIDLQDFAFISSRRDIAVAERFVDRLPAMLQS